MGELEIALQCMGSTSVGLTGARGYIGGLLLGGRRPLWKALEGASPDLVVHLAARPSDDLETFLTNIAVDAAVFEYCNRSGSGLIYASGNNVYPLAEDCAEADAYSHSDYYSLSKVTGEKLLLAGCFPRLESIILRIGDVFGLGQRHGTLFKAIGEALASQRPLQLYGGGKKTRSYIYSKELIRVVTFCIARFDELSGQVFNLCHDEAMSVAQILGRIAQISGLQLERVEREARSDCRTMSNEKIKKFGYSFAYSLEEALEDFVREATGS